MLTIWQPFWFAMVAILNQKWSPKYKDPAIWAKFQVSKGSAVWFEFNIFAPWLPRQRPPF
jgi:hypothetical protein